ncbi:MULTISPECIES: dihydrodipicolinate synthase family protein [Mesorhizobium]|nr:MULTISPECIES: dihydrodipicolinate synthase family protein [Mesorhizobium]TPJ43743.1 hypothetical protein FJ437_20510 [Mesorhizobium sp. B2-6-6]MCA0002897.1 dihydrodipicolinate synthase family protein [Mesorhizobium sp. B264B2A]MCA0009183.1 dihydrodipicolinate synthase family protein [Mesorhizobium sp. B264B1B]MCA0014016.1 dihydrodipicolinate synthase family protein [Mesorhizobium sp. B294B1A1]MCA0018764.1 dihydrodipicolinate synthase family protein [Mesorhizobium sp. B264B1A]
MESTFAAQGADLITDLKQANVGALRTDEAVKYASDAKALGAAAGFSPLCPTVRSLRTRFSSIFTTVARESGLPIVIYDDPANTHFRFTPALIRVWDSCLRSSL